MHQRQGWKTETEDGGVREVQANRIAGNWRFRSRLKGVKEWTLHDPPLVEDVQYLRDLLERKYRRRRASLKTVKEVEHLLNRICP